MEINVIESLAVKIPIKKGEEIRRYLSYRNILRKDLKIRKQGDYLLLPITNSDEKISFPIVKEKFELHKQKIRSYKDLLTNLGIPLDKFPTSFDIVGDIILMKIPSELTEYRNMIGNALLKVHPHIRSVYNIKPVSGELRTREVEIIAGEDRSITIHKEYGALFHIDIAKTFYSPRLAAERRRIVSLVRDEEVILDMFTGVAPFPVLIAKYANPKKIYAIDKNKEAISFARRNIAINGVEDVVELIQGDARDIRDILLDTKVDRVIMNLPFSAYKFIPYALKVIKPRATIHYYDILREDSLEKRKRELEDISFKYDFNLYFKDVRKIKTYAPREFYIGMDIMAVKKPM